MWYVPGFVLTTGSLVGKRQEEIGSEEDQKGQKIKAPKEKIELFRDQLAR